MRDKDRKATTRELLYCLVGRPLALGTILYAGLLGCEILKARGSEKASNLEPTARTEQVVSRKESDLEEKVENVQESVLPAQVKEEANVQAKPQEKVKEYPNPKTDETDFASDSDVILLARAIYGEARGQIEKNPDYVYGSTRSIITRANRKGVRIRDIMLKNKAYSCFNPDDANYQKLRDPLNKGDGKTPEERIESWEKCYDLAENALSGSLQGRADLRDVTNYFVGGDPRTYRTKKEAKEHGIPSWAYKMKDNKFVLDKDGKRIPREYKKVEMGKRGAYFYDFGKRF